MHKIITRSNKHIDKLIKKKLQNSENYPYYVDNRYSYFSLIIMVGKSGSFANVMSDPMNHYNRHMQ